MKSIDYAKTEHMAAWLRHPVLGDPSFDTFEKLGGTVHTSSPPYEWAVNGSLFRDPADGAWYYFAGLYPAGYNADNGLFDFIIYRSRDEGKTWEHLGRGFDEDVSSGFRFDGYDVPANSHPDVVMTYDPDTKLYWLAYDWLTAAAWGHAHHPTEKTYNSGAALAWAKSPAGPFTRLTSPIFGNLEISRKIGRFSRAYGTTVFKRRTDWIALALCDSADYFSWGLIGMTAPSPEGPWSEPTILLSVDRPEYYPAPVEFYPCFVVGETLYAPATSVAMNRNYQTMHTASLEDAHRPDAWKLSGDGNAWHARPLTDEKYSIWGQTYHGFVNESDGKFTVMYPSRDDKGFGTLSVAQRPWDTPFRDGFTFSGHEGKSISPLMRACKHFTLDAEFTFVGTIELAFDYGGILGPNRPVSNAVPGVEAFSNYTSLRFSADGNYTLLSTSPAGKNGEITEQALARGTFATHESGHVAARLCVKEKSIEFTINGTSDNVTKNIHVAGGPLALIAHEFSLMTCSKFCVTHEAAAAEAPLVLASPCRLRYHAYDALLGAGQRLVAWEPVAAAGLDCISNNALIGPAGADGNRNENRNENVPAYGKWNVIGREFRLFSPKSPTLGRMRVVVDGEHNATVDLYSEVNVPSSPVYTGTLNPGRHAIAVFPETGKIALDVVEVFSGGEKGEA